MQIFDKEFGKLDTNQENDFSLDKIFVDHKGEKVKLSSLYVVKKDKEGRPVARKIRSVADFKKNVQQNLVFKNPTGKTTDLIFKSTDMWVVVLPEQVPSVHESISLNKTIDPKRPATLVLYDDIVPYGLRRALKTERKDVDDGKYFYAEVNGNWQFVEAEEVHYYEGTEKKTLKDLLKTSPAEAKDKILFDQQGRTISSIYTEYTYNFPEVVATESFNTANYTKTTYDLERGKKTEPIDVRHGEQEYVVKTVADEKKPGKTKQVSQLKVKNFKAVKNGQFYALTVDNETKMVHAQNIVDASGNHISDLQSFVGNPVYIKENDKTLTSAPVTYEQAVVTFDTVKTYQTVEGGASDKTCLRLSDGTYVKELTSVQPKAFAVVPESVTDFDCYLVEQTVGGQKKFVVVDREYFSKYGKSAGLNPDKHLKLKRCDINSKSCAVIQTTSKGAKIENCSVVGEVKFGEETLERADKIQQQNSFLAEYRNGNYDVEDVYIDGEKKELAKGNVRYEYTDEMYLSDVSSRSLQYLGMKTKDIQIKDGKVVGGAKYSVGKAISKGYGKWSNFLFTGFAPCAAAGIFIPVVGPIAFTAYTVGMALAIPGIPLVSAGIGIAKNMNMVVKRQAVLFKDKNDYNRKYIAKQCEKRIQELYEKGLTPEQFNDAYSKLINKISSLSQCANKNVFVVENGVGKVTNANANLANKYKHEYNKLQKQIGKLDNKLAKLDKKDSLSAKKQAKYDSIKTIRDGLKVDLESLKNISYGKNYKIDERMDNLLSIAEDMRLALYVQREKDNILNKLIADLKVDGKVNAAVVEQFKNKAQTLLGTLKFSVKDGITLNGISLDTPKDELGLKKLDEMVWVKVQEAIQKISLEEVSAQEPKDEQVLNKALILKEIAESLDLCHQITNEVKVAIEEIKEFKIKSTLNKQNNNLIKKIQDLELAIRAEDNVAILQQKLEEIKLCKTECMEFEETEKQVVEVIEQINIGKDTFDKIIVDLENEINNLTPKNKIKYSDKTEKLKNDVKLIISQAKSAMTKDELGKSLEELNKKIDEAKITLEDVKSATARQSVENAIARIAELYNMSVARHAEIQDSEAIKIVPKLNEEIENCVLVLKDYKEKSEVADIEKEQVLQLLKKAEKAYKLVEISAKATNIFQNLIENKATKDLKRAVGSKLIELSGVIKINTNTEYDVLVEKEEQANKILGEIQVYVATETKQKAKKEDSDKVEGEPSKKYATNKTLSAQEKLKDLLNIIVSEIDDLSQDDVPKERRNEIKAGDTYDFFKKLKRSISKILDKKATDKECGDYLDAMLKEIEKLHLARLDAQKELPSEQRAIITKCYRYIGVHTTELEQDN